MGNYVNSNLIPGEVVRYEGSLHWSVWAAWCVYALLIFVVSLLSANKSGDSSLVFGGVGAAVVLLGIAYLQVAAFEFVVTNKRLIYKNGIIKRESFDQMLNKVDSVMIEQGIIERMIGSGKITIHTSGATHNAQNIADPAEFRRQFYLALDEFTQGNV